MAANTVATAAAAATVGSDLLSSVRSAQAPNDRVLNSISVTGSAVIGDTEVEVFIDDVSLGNYFNSALLTPQRDRDRQDMEQAGWPAGARLQSIVRDAPTTSILYFKYDYDDIVQ